jgi:hypothetical protein
MEIQCVGGVKGSLCGKILEAGNFWGKPWNRRERKERLKAKKVKKGRSGKIKKCHLRSLFLLK